MTAGVVTLKSMKKSRLVDVFERHSKSHISDIYIPGMVPPFTEQRLRIYPPEVDLAGMEQDRSQK
jgi:hypothetical protein